MPFLSICIVESDLTSDIDATHYIAPDFERKTLVSLCLEIAADGILKAIEGTELPGQLFSYIRGLHKHALPQSDKENSLSSTTSLPEVRGGKTFASIMKPVLLFFRYTTDRNRDNMVRDLIDIIALGALIQMKQFPGSSLALQMLSMPEVAKRVKVLRSAVGKKELDLMDHEFDQQALGILIASQR